MTTKRSVPEGPAQWVFEARSRPWPPGLALLGLALVGLIQAGCRSDGCSNCGLGSAIASGFQAVGSSVKAVGSFVFHHKRGCGGGSDCGCGGEVGGYEEGVVVDQGVAGVLMVPGAMSIPAPGTIVPAPAIESEPTQLQAIPNSQPANPTSGSGPGSVNTPTKPTTTRSSPSGANRSGYTTGLPRGAPVVRRGSEADQAAFSSSARTARPNDAGSSIDLLDNIPPVDLPSEVTRKAVATPAKAAVPPPAASTSAGVSDKTTEPLTPPAERISAAEEDALILPPISPAVALQAPGLRRYASIAPAISGGSAPSIEGLDWLKEKGCRTLLDLRRSSEVTPNFADAVNDRGMVYISLPILANRLDPSRMARFDEMISRTENRPLFFCDADGSRAALAWYIHERVIGQEDPQAALGKAEELGLSPADIMLAEEYLARHKPRVKAAMARVAVASSALLPDPTNASTGATEPPLVTPPALPEIPTSPTGPVVLPALPPKFEEAIPQMLPGEGRPQASARSLFDRDPASWRPLAALVLTGVGVPLAFWSRSYLSETRTSRRRASLPGKAPRSLGSPIGSDA